MLILISIILFYRKKFIQPKTVGSPQLSNQQSPALPKNVYAHVSKEIKYFKR